MSIASSSLRDRPIGSPPPAIQIAQKPSSRALNADASTRPAGLQLDADWIGDAASRNHIRRFTAPDAAARMVRPPGPGA